MIYLLKSIKYRQIRCKTQFFRMKTLPTDYFTKIVFQYWVGYMLSKIDPMNRILIIESKEKITTTAGFEPARETPRDFESLALTPRPNCLS